jgi:hypothetical protein
MDDKRTSVPDDSSDPIDSREPTKPRPRQPKPKGELNV